jgi:RNA polymerase sigma factor (TIGR02999 family)
MAGSITQWNFCFNVDLEAQTPTPSLSSPAAKSLMAALCLPMLDGKRKHLNRRMSELTQILSAVSQGQGQPTEELLPLVYAELRRLAAWLLANEKPGQTLQATALVHEAYLRLVGHEDPGWQGRRHFFGAAAEAMRRILVENARRKKRLKHGGQWERVELEDLAIAAPLPDDELLAVDEALDGLTETDPRAAELVKLCFFVGLTQEQAARELGVSISTVERTWAFARAWLFREIQKGQKSPE